MSEPDPNTVTIPLTEAARIAVDLGRAHAESARLREAFGALADEWDAISKGESVTTRRIREVLAEVTR